MADRQRVDERERDALPTDALPGNAHAGGPMAATDAPPGDTLADGQLAATDALAGDHGAGAPAPRRSVVACATPGLHSGLVAAALRHCGAGEPLEYFDVAAVAAPLVRQWRVLNLDEYISALHQHRSTADGVFGVVLQWSHLRWLHRQVTGVTQLTAGRTLPVLARIAPAAHYVLVREAARDMQAVRLTLARAAPGGAARPHHVAANLTLIEAAERAWLRWFDDAGIAPVTLTVHEGPAFEPALPHLAERLGLRPPAADLSVSEPALTAPGQDLLRRFRADRADGVLEVEPLLTG